MRCRKMIIGIVIVLLIVWAIAVYDVNNRFPDAKYMEYRIGDSVTYANIELIPKSVNVYTSEEFATAYPSDMTYEKLREELKRYILVYEVELYNNTSEVQKYYSVELIAFGKNSVWSNGVSPLNGQSPYVTLKPNESTTVYLTSNISETSIKSQYVDNIQKEQFGLVVTYYPENIVLLFE